MSLTQTETKTKTIQLLTLTIQKKRVTWHESVIDNEHMNKRKSNKCCIFHPQHNLNDCSSDSDSDSDSDSE
jgi:protein phosphatase 1 regulatory subunit 11